jgi:DNA polymerase III subunit epsilon
MSRLGSRIYAFLDVETTGLSAWFGDRICEIAVIRCQGDDLVASFDSLINPDRLISPGAARVNGLKDSDLAHAPRFPDVASSVLTLLQEAVIVCHNAPFDLGFLSSELGRTSQSLPAAQTLDTLGIARAHFAFGSNSLQSIAHALQIETGSAHRALDDAYTTREVLARFAEGLPGTEIESAIAPYVPPHSTSLTFSLPPAVEEALQSNRRLFIRYTDGKGAVSERWITPREVRALNDYLYLVAHCHLRDDERSFRLDRIERMDVEL